MSEFRTEIEQGEYWWGGTNIHAYCPLSRNSVFYRNLTNDAPNQAMPFFVSTNGRYIWSDNPFIIKVKDGVITLTGEDIVIEKAGDCLRSAYLEAQKKHFPCDGKELEPLFFSMPQYNSWIQFAYYPTQEKVLAWAHDIINHGYQPGILIIDEGWHISTGYGRWEFDFARFPDPKAMVEELHSMGFIIMLWVTPFVTPVGPDFFRSTHALIGTDPESAKRIYMRTENGDVAIMKWWNGVGAILDFTNPYDRDFLSGQLSHLIEDYGIDGFKFDGGNMGQYRNENVINGSYATDKTAVELNVAWNEFGTQYRFHEYKDTFKGGGKNAIQRLHDRDHSWTGNGINEIIPCVLNAGLMGYPFICPDMIGGGEWRNRYTPGFVTDEELFVRMAQCSALFPMMQFSWAPWEALSEENSKLCLEASKLHISMSDEISALVKSATFTGEPILRCLEYNYPHCGYAEITDEYMLGESILVAPVVLKGQTERSVTFPEGRWQSQDGKIHNGGETVTLQAPLDTLLWFRKV